MEGAPLWNPRAKAGFLSLLTFSWMNNVLKLGSKQPLEEKHLFPVENSNQAERLVADLEREWLAEERASEHNRTKPRLWKAMMRVVSCRDYVTVVLIRILYSLSSNSLPLLLWFYLRSISATSRASYSTTLAFVISIALTSSLRMFCNTHWIFKVEVIAIRLKAAVIGFVYKKVSNSSLIPNSIISNSSILLLLLLILLLLLHLCLYLLLLYLSFSFISLLPSSLSILLLHPQSLLPLHSPKTFSCLSSPSFPYTLFLPPPSFSLSLLLLRALPPSSSSFPLSFLHFLSPSSFCIFLIISSPRLFFLFLHLFLFFLPVS